MKRNLPEVEELYLLDKRVFLKMNQHHLTIARMACGYGIPDSGYCLTTRRYFATAQYDGKINSKTLPCC